MNLFLRLPQSNANKTTVQDDALKTTVPTTSISSGQNSSIRETEVDYVSRIIQARRWDDLTRLLRSRSRKEISKVKDSTNLNLLGMALGSQAPANVVELILQLNPQSVLERDDFGAVPLHLGCLNGISVEVMKILFKYDGGGQSAHVADNDNRTALHHAVEFTCLTILQLHEDDSSSLSLVYEASTEVVEELLNIAPENVHVITTRGDCPLDIPHEFKIKLNNKNEDKDPKIDEIYNLLKEASLEIYRSCKKSWEMAGFDTNSSS